MMNLLEEAQGCLRGVKLLDEQMPKTDYVVRMMADFTERSLRNVLLFIYDKEGGEANKNRTTVEKLATQLALANTGIDLSNEDFIKNVTLWKNAKNYPDGEVYFEYSVEQVFEVGDKIQRFIDSVASMYELDVETYKYQK